MLELPFSKTSLFLYALTSLLLLVFIWFVKSSNQQTTIVFCDVGQGDGTYIRVHNSFDLLIDAGPDRKILDCLGKYMPFYDHKIELALISHSQKDHYGGFLSVLDHYDIAMLIMNPVNNPVKSFQTLVSKLKTKNISLKAPIAGDFYRLGSAQIEFFWPSDSFIYQNLGFNQNSDYFFRDSYRDYNEFSLIMTLHTDGKNILFTGDADPKILSNVSETLIRNKSQSKLNSEILKVPHHGSKNGLTSHFLKLADPIYGVISVGKNNSFGHPSDEVLDMLLSSKIKIKRTDLDGDIVFKF